MLAISQSQAEAIAGPFFGLSLFPYLAFLYFLNTPKNKTPKGVTVGFATCLLFVFLTIPAAITAQVQYGVSLADCDWLHGSAESLLTITNLVTVVAFRQAISSLNTDSIKYKSVDNYAPMIQLVILLTILAGFTALIPAFSNAAVHTPYLNGILDLPSSLPLSFGNHADPENSLTVACWIIHISSLVEFLVAMGFCWRWADLTENSKWKGVTWGLLPLHSSGITACTYHLFYNQVAVLVPLQAFLTCVGNTTAAFAAYRLAISNGWTFDDFGDFGKYFDFLKSKTTTTTFTMTLDASKTEKIKQEESPTLVGFEDLGDALQQDNDYTFLFKLFLGCAVASYLIKYGELFFDFPFESNVFLSLAFIFIPSILNAFKWYKRSQDPTFEGWF